MRVEIRASGGDTCERCGSYDLIHVNATGEPLAADFGAIVERICRDREHALLDAFQAERGEWENTMNEAVQVMRDELKAQRERLARDHAAYEQRVQEIVGRPVRRWRIVKRRWQRNLNAEVLAAVEELQEQTRRA